MRLPAWLRRRPVALIAPTPEPAPKPGMKVRPFALDGWQMADGSAFVLAKPVPGVVPPGAALAMDDVNTLYSYAVLNAQGSEISFPGFPTLAELAQRPEYRHISDTLAREMTRKWGHIVSSGDDDKSDKIERLEALLEEHDVAQKFRLAAAHDGLFGRGHLFIELNGENFGPGLERPLLRNPRAIRAGTKVRFQNVEPIWTYPNTYNANNPLAPDFYVPQTWYVNGTSVHRSRLLPFIGRPLPDMLKPAYGFAGMSLSQMAIPYVQNWLRTRQSVSDMLHSFSIPVLSTMMDAVLQGGGAESLINRAQLFNQARDNRGLMMIDKENEEVTIVSAPLSSLDKLQAQAVEQMAMVATQPLVVLTGITPSGLNASSDGEIRVWYDRVHAAQEAIFTDPMQIVLDVLQLSEFGDIDPTIRMEWEPLWQLDEAGEAAVRKTNADTDIEYVQNGVVSPEEIRERLARDTKSGFVNLDPADLPEPPEAPGGGLTNDPETNKVDSRGEEAGYGGGASATSGA